MIKLMKMNEVIKIVRSVTFSLIGSLKRFFLDFFDMIKDPQDNARQLVLAFGILIIATAALVTFVYMIWSGIKNRGVNGTYVADDGFPKDDHLKVK